MYMHISMDSHDSQDFESVARHGRVIVTSIATYQSHPDGDSNMKATTRLLAAALTALAVSGAVYAEDALPQAPASTRTIYEGVDAQGQIVRVTITRATDAQSVVVASNAQRYPELNWTARIGSGTAATIAH